LKGLRRRTEMFTDDRAGLDVPVDVPNVLSKTVTDHHDVSITYPQQHAVSRGFRRAWNQKSPLLGGSGDLVL
jgi:hypothetical protein